MKWGEFIQGSIDKLILLVVLGCLLALIVNSAGNPNLVDWLKNEAGTIIGALITLITGKVVASHFLSQPDPTEQPDTQKQVKKQ